MAQGRGAEIGKMFLRIVDQCKAMFAEQVVPLNVLLEDDGLTNLYNYYQDMWDCQQYYELLGHAKPNMKILEIGAGTSGTTAHVLKNLVNKRSDRMYSEYCFTDISGGFFVAAKERFKDVENIKYTVLDISKDPVEQGFEAGAYDHIIASNVCLL